MAVLTSDGSSLSIVLASEPMVLVSYWKPIIPLLIFGVWAWIISTVYDKHAARFFLPRERWNAIHLTCGVAALAAAYLMPMTGIVSFFAGIGAMILILFGDLVAYAMSANKDERVPEQFRIGVNVFRNMAEKREEKKKAKAQGTVKLTIKGPNEKGQPTVLVAAPEGETPEYALRVAAEDLYLKAMVMRASQIDIAPTGKDQAYAVSMLVDGVRVPGETMPAQNALRLIDFWKSCARLDVNDRRRKLTADIVVEQAAGKKKVRVSSVGVTGGMRLTMLFDPDTSVVRKPDTLGFLESQAAEIKELINQTVPKGPDDKPTRGVVVLGGQPDGGRTTTLIGILQMHDAYTQSVQTVEMEIQGQIEGVRHTAFDAQQEGADFSTTVRSMLRRDPDVLGVAEMPDAATAQVIAKGDHDRTRVYIGLRADTAMEAIEKFAAAVGEPALAAKALRGVVVGKLVRKLCTNCKVGYPPSPDMLKKMGVTERVAQLFKKGGQVLIKNKPDTCPVCGGVGYVGQEGVFEVFMLDDEAREAVAQNNMPAVKAALKKRGLPTLQQAAVQKAVKGITSVEEMQRVFAARPSGSPAPAPSNPPPAAAKAG